MRSTCYQWIEALTPFLFWSVAVPFLIFKFINIIFF